MNYIRIYQEYLVYVSDIILIDLYKALDMNAFLLFILVSA
ncbi:hypothetical protein EMIT019CA3_30132 [Bacillus pseudomycoides]